MYMYMEIHDIVHGTLAFIKEKEKKGKATHPSDKQTYIHGNTCA